MTSLNANTPNAAAGEITLTTESVVSLYIFPLTGTHARHQIALQVTPDGTNWLEAALITGLGIETRTVAATKARAKVISREGVVSTVDVQLVAR